MNADRHRLLHGPYQPPALHRGDRATCLFRDADVVITSWTAARIPWSRCRSLDTHGGGSGLLANEELARAVRCESVVAASRAGGKVLKRDGLPDDVCDARSEKARQLGLIRFAQAHPAHPPWTAEEEALLGTAPDAEVAQRIGRTAGAVRQRRTALGIPTWRDRRFR